MKDVALPAKVVKREAVSYTKKRGAAAGVVTKTTMMRMTEDGHIAGVKKSKMKTMMMIMMKIMMRKRMKTKTKYRGRSVYGRYGDNCTYLLT
jgi:hypothetical protein